MQLTHQHLDDINRFILGTLPNREQHFLWGFLDDYILYGTGPTQLGYLAAVQAAFEAIYSLDPDNELVRRHQPGTVTSQGVQLQWGAISGKKHLLPQVSNFWIQFGKNVTPVPTGSIQKPIALAGQFDTEQSKSFYREFESSPLGLSNATPGQLQRGMQKHRPNAPTLTNHIPTLVQNYLRQYAVRRASKFLMYDSIARGSPIRYALDGLNLEWVARKIRVDPRTNTRDDNGKLPICASELREIFRYWDFFNNRVTFYLDFRVVSPPWSAPTASQETIKAWAAYAGHRANKVLSSGNDMPGSRRDHLEMSIDAYFEGNYPATIREYHLSLPSRFGKMNLRINDALPGQY